MESRKKLQSGSLIDLPDVLEGGIINIIIINNEF
jgi:hypothetical protein